MSETLNINEFEANQGKIDKLTSKTATINTVDSQNVTINTLTADFIKLKNQIELLSEELKIIKGSKELVKISANRTDVNTSLYANNELVSLPIGTVIAFAGKNIPDGWLICDGASTKEHPRLKEVIGDRLPNLENRFIMGLSINEHSSIRWGNRYDGNSSIKLIEANLPPHDHLYSDAYSKFSISYKNASDGMTGSGASKITSTSNEDTLVSKYTAKNENFKSLPVDINPQHFKLLYIIKAL